MNTIDNLKSLLKQQEQLIRQIYPHPDWKYGGFEELVLDCGREFNQFSTQNIERGIPKSCYWNCQQLLKKYPELIYCEGYALAPDILIPLKHSWLINKQQEIIEPTWDANDSIYLGIPLNTLWFQSILDERSAQGREDEISILEGNYLENFSLLREGLPKEVIALPQ